MNSLEWVTWHSYRGHEWAEIILFNDNRLANSEWNVHPTANHCVKSATTRCTGRNSLPRLVRKPPPAGCSHPLGHWTAAPAARTRPPDAQGEDEGHVARQSVELGDQQHRTQGLAGGDGPPRLGRSSRRPDSISVNFPTTCPRLRRKASTPVRCADRPRPEVPGGRSRHGSRPRISGDPAGCSTGCLCD